MSYLDSLKFKFWCANRTPLSSQIYHRDLWDVGRDIHASLYGHSPLRDKPIVNFITKRND